MVNKKPSLFFCLLPIFFMLFLTSLGFKYDILIEPLMIIATFVAGIIAILHGYKYSEILSAIIDKISQALPALLILISVGMLIGTWMVGGTLSMMIYYGLKIISAKYLLITAFIITAFTSVCTGTSWGSAGTIGVALMGVGIGLDYNLAALAGAIISGSYFGDKISPLSDSTNIAPIAAGSNLYEHIQHLLWTTLPSFFLASIVYFIYGLMRFSDTALLNSEKIDSILFSLESNFNFNPIILLPLVIVLYGSITKKPPVPTMVFSSFVAMINSFVFQGFKVQDIFKATVSGFNSSMLEGLGRTALNPDISKLLERGGMASMQQTVLIAFIAYSFAGAVSVTGSFSIILDSFISKIKSVGALILTTVASCLVMVGVTADGTLSLLIGGEFFKNEYIKRGLAPKNLSRTLEDSVTVTETLIPWTKAAVYMSTTLGVATLDYLPWAILNYSGILFAILWGFTGIGIAKLKS